MKSSATSTRSMGYSTQEAIRAWENGIDEQLDLEWFINGVLYRTSKKPVAV